MHSKEVAQRNDYIQSLVSSSHKSMGILVDLVIKIKSNLMVKIEDFQNNMTQFLRIEGTHP